MHFKGLRMLGYTRKRTLHPAIFSSCKKTKTGGLLPPPHRMEERVGERRNGIALHCPETVVLPHEFNCDCPPSPSRTDGRGKSIVARVEGGTIRGFQIPTPASQRKIPSGLLLSHGSAFGGT